MIAAEPLVRIDGLVKHYAEVPRPAGVRVSTNPW